ncbi:MAG: hypothetical protein A2149_00975 [Candidatus Schekmanbacteria bacterium RBG_16_38_11]|uniref:VanZ-like domain-containing protein n=2 Tax=Candidatus Schekmaniibacteriota TaxID=1817811 RepID=A0A1F7RB70_9BACT|nr:MAG: hypothetical protein A2042_01020 [Candidatus Schekmanbacteria bacterium GWA2_38_11]OGL47662.1 MAG: hypothetical protein A2149_00975 [Candidatus Schekmanbacteria bacterium RBG_16_38_11]
MNEKREKKSYIFIKLWGPVILWCLLIFSLSNQQDLTVDIENEFLLRKFAHVTEYAVLTFLLFRALYKWPRERIVSPMRLKIISISFSIGFALVFAMSDEFHQIFIQGRNGNPYDVMIDSIGMMLVGLILIKRE